MFLPSDPLVVLHPEFGIGFIQLGSIEMIKKEKGKDEQHEMFKILYIFRYRS